MDNNTRGNIQSNENPGNEKFLILKRTMQMMEWVEERSFNIDPGLPVKDVTKLVYETIQFIINNFFTGCGLSYNPEDQELKDDSFYITIVTPFNTHYVNVNFSPLLNYIKYIICIALHRSGYKWRNFMSTSEVDILIFEFIMMDQSDISDGPHEYISFDRSVRMNYTPVSGAVQI